METTAPSVLGRKTVAGRHLKEARAMSMPKALRLAMSKSADTLFDMALAVIGATQSVMGQADLCKLFEADKLMLLLDGPNGQPGAALLDSTVVSALVQQQTMGRVTSPTDEDRPMTRTDAAMSAPLLDDVFSRVTELLETESEKSIVRGFQFGAQVLDPRLIGLSLEENDYHVLRLTLDIAAGTRQGDVLLAFPVITAVNRSAAEDHALSGTAMGLHDTVMAVKTELDAVLCKLRVPLRDVQSWSVGTVLPVDRDALEETTLHAQTGRKLGVGKLGQKAGFRALRLVKKSSETYTGPDRRGMHALLGGDDKNDPVPIGNFADTMGAFDMDAAADGTAFDATDAPAFDMAAFEPEQEGDGPADLMADFPAMGDTGDLPDLPPLDFDTDSDDLPELPPLTS